MDDLVLSVLNAEMVSLMEDVIGSQKLGVVHGLKGREMSAFICKASEVLCNRMYFTTLERLSLRGALEFYEDIGSPTIPPPIIPRPPQVTLIKPVYIPKRSQARGTLGT